MGLKDLKSNLDLVAGNDPVGGMEDQQGPQFQRPLDVADQAHKDSLQQVPGGTSNSPFQDLDGAPDPNFNTLNGTSDSPFKPRGKGTGDHMKDLLNSTITSTNTNQTYNPSTQDLGGVDNGNGNFHGIANPGQGQGKQIKKQDLHVHLLQKEYKYNHGNSTAQVGEGTFDLNGETGGNGYFHGIANPGALNGIQLNGVDLHEALLGNSYNYAHGISSGNYQSNVEISAGGFDLNGNLPTTGEYINNLPQ